QIGVRLPIWSDEKTNLDWMPDFALPSSILDYNGGMAAAAIAGYRAAPTRENLTRAVSAIRSAANTAANPAAPCLLDDPGRAKYRECFEVRRWASTLVTVYMLRNGMSQNLGGDTHDIWWDVGQAARKSRADASIPIANPVENWAAWMFLGWSFDPSRHSTSYTGEGFSKLGLPRQATFIALRSQVARPKNSASIYEDYVNAVRFAPASWTLPVATFALRHISERLAAGDRPSVASIVTAITQLYSGLSTANNKLPIADRGKLDALVAQLVAALGK
ncbi:MAG TPA: hypothetical protein VM099_06830, partial [Gemmatimonadaceae bacterium]|nr:hypothetical protein [Gemmatimonadaceae bacterium]